MKLILKWPKSAMEKEMKNIYHISTVELINILPSGYARVKDSHGVIWHCHPESFEGTEYTANPACQQRHHHHNGIYCGECKGWA